MSQQATIKNILQYPVVPVFYHPEIEVSTKVFDACYKGGVRVFEFTNRGKNAFDQFKTLKGLLNNYPGYMLGIGTIFTGPDAEKFIEAGASFVISPCYIGAVADVCYQNKIPYLPGCMTVKEVFDASQAGCDMVKIFPGDVLGPSFVKGVKAVLPNVKQMITGGVEPTSDSLKKWFGSGADAVGMGSQLFQKNWLVNGEFEKIEEACKSAFDYLPSK